MGRVSRWDSFNRLSVCFSQKEGEAEEDQKEMKMKNQKHENQKDKKFATTPQK
jgi:hypothetical protein